MGGITEKITEFIKDLLTGWITSNLDTMFTDVNTKVETIATEVGKTPQNWNSGIFSMIKNLSDNVIVPIAGMIITFVLCYELISMIMEKNNMHDTDTFMFFKYIFKMWVAVYLVTHTFDIAMAIFDVANHVVSNAGGMITGSASIDVTEALKTLLETQIEDMGNDAGQFMSKNHISPDYRHFIWTNDRNISLCLCGTYSVFNIYEQGMGKYWK